MIVTPGALLLLKFRHRRMLGNLVVVWYFAAFSCCGRQNAMNNSYEELRLGGDGRNVEYLGAFVAWLVTNRLLSDHLEKVAGSAIARVRMQDMTGPAFLTTALHGELGPSHLSADGQQFAERYLKSGQYRQDYNACTYVGENEWHRFDELSPKITAAYRGPSTQTTTPARGVAKILSFPSRRK